MTDFIIHKQKRNKILEMVKEEQKVRYSKGIQEAYTEQYYNQKENPNYNNISIEAEIQKYILRQFGFKDDENSLQEYWKIPSTYWNDEEIKNNIFYMKLNIFKYPKISINDNYIDTRLLNYTTNTEVFLSGLQTHDRPFVLLAGSMT
jgi:hypothetical protein